MIHGKKWLNINFEKFKISLKSNFLTQNPNINFSSHSWLVSQVELCLNLMPFVILKIHEIWGWLTSSAKQLMSGRRQWAEAAHEREQHMSSRSQWAEAAHEREQNMNGSSIWAGAAHERKQHRNGSGTWVGATHEREQHMRGLGGSTHNITIKEDNICRNTLIDII